MNKTNIEWCDFTWNPITGCKHPCRRQYCYNTRKATSALNRFGARYLVNGKIKADRNWWNHETGGNHIAKKGEVYPFGYDPTLYPHRMDEPREEKEPSRIFVVDTGDLFGRWVPVTWIRLILQVAVDVSQRTYMFLTKNPKKMINVPFPENAWAGTSVNSDRDVGRANIIKQVNARVRYLSIEPLLGPVTFPFDNLEWIIVGAQTGKQPPIPDLKWVQDIEAECRRRRIPLFVKGNLAKIYPQFAKYRQHPNLRTAKNRRPKKAVTAKRVSGIIGISTSASRAIR